MEIRKGYKRTEVGIIPEDWGVKELKELSKMKSGKGITSKDIKKLGRYPCYGGNGQRGYTDQYTHDGEFVLIGRQGALCGNVLSVEGTFFASEHAVVVSSNCETDIKWISYKLKYMELNQYSESSAQPGLSVEKVLKLKVACPSDGKEQQAIATALSDIDGLISSLTKLIDKKKNIKQGAMQELLTGKKRLEGFSGEWIRKPLADLFDFSGGYSASRAQLSAEGYCYLHYGDIHGSNKQFIDVESEYSDIPKIDIQLSKVAREKMLQDGDVVFVDASEDDEGTSRHIVIINPNNLPYISGLHTIIAKSKNDILDKKFRQYCFQSIDIKNQFKFYAVGTKVSGISRSNIVKIKLNFPISKEEQTAIANILSDMDAEIEALERKLNKYKSIKQGMMQELLTGRIRLV